MSEPCFERIDDLVFVLRAVAIISVGVTWLNWSIVRLTRGQVRHGRWSLSAWKHTAAWCLLFGVAKIGVSIWFFIDIRCPSGCTCTGLGTWYLYPSITMFFGIVWILRAKQISNLARPVHAIPQGQGATSDLSYVAVRDP